MQAFAAIAPPRIRHARGFFISAALINLFILAAMLVLASGTVSARGQEQAAEPAPHTATSRAATQIAFVRPGDMGAGGLLLPSKREGLYVEAPRLATDVDIAVSGPIARVQVTQRFTNPSEGWVEGIYVFPLPEDSAVDTLTMKIGERIIKGVIKPRVEARQIYETAKREGKKAALVEQQRPNLFTNAVANIGPGETVIVQIAYQQGVQKKHGEFSLRFPMVVAPRYNPKPLVQQVDFSDGSSGWGSIDPVPDRDKITPPVLDPRENAKINPVTLTIRLAAGFPLGEMVSPFHKLISRQQDDSTRILTLEAESVPADRDFELVWKAAGTAPSAALFSETIDGEHYVLAFVTPPRQLPEGFTAPAREVIFVIDNSGSMAGASIVHARKALATALAKLTAADRFNVIRFDDTYTKLFPAAVRADRENVDKAVAYVGALEAEGGTEMLPALAAALEDSAPAGHVRQVVFITDGAIGNEQQLFDMIAKARGGSRVFTIGIGSAPNSYFMRRAAELGRGTFTHIGSTEQVSERMGAFLAQLENPVMTELTAGGVALMEASPAPLPDLYLGEPVVLAAKLADLSGALEISGDFAGQPWSVSMDLANAANGSGVAKLWARRKIASLEASRSYNANVDIVDKQITKTALDHHLVSRLTSLVAVDATPVRPDGEPLSSTEIPLNLPHGWDPEVMFDQAASAPHATRSLMRRTAAAVAARPTAGTAAEAKLLAANAQLSLPQTATPAERNMMIGALLMLLAAILLFVQRRLAGRIRVNRHAAG